MPQAGQHSWSEPHREERHTDRACWVCGLVKRTRHEGGRHWQEFYRAGRLVAKAGDRTPPCPGSPQQQAVSFEPKRNVQTNGDAHEAHH